MFTWVDEQRKGGHQETAKNSVKFHGTTNEISAANTRKWNFTHLLGGVANVEKRGSRCEAAEDAMEQCERSVGRQSSCSHSMD